MLQHLPSSTSSHEKAMFLDCNFQLFPHSSISAWTPLVKWRKARGTVEHYSNSWELTTFPWSNNLTFCYFVHQRGKFQNHALCFFLIWAEVTQIPDKLSSTDRFRQPSILPDTTHIHSLTNTCVKHTQLHKHAVCLERQFSPPGSTKGDTTNRPDQTRQPADR